MKKRKMTYKQIAAALALILGGCSGGGGLSAAAPGALAPPTAAPTLTLAVSPAQIAFASVGQTATLTATRSDHAANATISYVRGCDSVATVSPSSTTTDANGVGHFTMMASSIGSCIVMFSSGPAMGSTSVGVVSTPPPSPSPSASPTAVPTVAPGPLTISPTNIYLGENSDGTPAATGATVSISDPNYSGSFAESDNCVGNDTFAFAGNVLTVTMTNGGTCTATITDMFGNTATLTIIGTTNILQPQVKHKGGRS